MFFIAIIGFLFLAAYYVTVYMRYKLLIWLGFRFLSGIAHKKDKARLLKETLLGIVVAWAVLYTLGWLFTWYGMRLSEPKLSFGADVAFHLGIIPMSLLVVVAFKVAKREFCTLMGFWEKDWNWANPDLKIFHISPENMPVKPSRRFNYGDNDNSDSGFMDICTPSDEEWQRYRDDNYDRIYNK